MQHQEDVVVTYSQESNVTNECLLSQHGQPSRVKTSIPIHLELDKYSSKIICIFLIKFERIILREFSLSDRH